MELEIQVALASALMASGFRLINVLDDDWTLTYNFLPCPVGTFSNSSSLGAEGCTPCPPGNLKYACSWFSHFLELRLIVVFETVNLQTKLSILVKITAQNN